MISTPGNIRVLCRLRPGTPSNLVSSEPGPGGTVTTCYRGHQRRFRLDWVFPPDASQEEVMLHPHTCVDPPSEPSARLGAKVPRFQQERERGWEAGLEAKLGTYVPPRVPLCVLSPSCTGPGGTDLVQAVRFNI